MAFPEHTYLYVAPRDAVPSRDRVIDLREIDDDTLVTLHRNTAVVHWRRRNQVDPDPMAVWVGKGLEVLRHHILARMKGSFDPLPSSGAGQVTVVADLQQQIAPNIAPPRPEPPRTPPRTRDRGFER